MLVYLLVGLGLFAAYKINHDHKDSVAEEDKLRPMIDKVEKDRNPVKPKKLPPRAEVNSRVSEAFTKLVDPSFKQKWKELVYKDLEYTHPFISRSNIPGYNVVNPRKMQPLI